MSAADSDATAPKVTLWPDPVRLDESIRQQHQAAQDAPGDTGGSPNLRIGERACFGPVLTAVPAAETAPALFDAVETLAKIPQFAQLQRPRAAA